MKTSESGVDQLIQRVKSEAIEKAQSEQAEIIRRARIEAATIIDKAKREAQLILSEAKNAISDEEKKVGVELTLAARDFSIRLHQRLKDQMLFPAIKQSVRATMKEPEFLKEVLVRLINEFVKTNPGNIDVLVPKELKTTLAAFFASAVFDGLDKNSRIHLLDEDGLEGFVLVQRGSNYVWDFSVATIAAELSRLVEPSLRKYFSTQAHANTPPSERAEFVEA